MLKLLGYKNVIAIEFDSTVIQLFKKNQHLQKIITGK